MPTIAFIEKEQGQGFLPCHVKEIKKDDVYYLVVDGERKHIHQAISDAIVDASKDEGWRVEGVLYE